MPAPHTDPTLNRQQRRAASSARRFVCRPAGFCSTSGPIDPVRIKILGDRAAQMAETAAAQALGVPQGGGVTQPIFFLNDAGHLTTTCIAAEAAVLIPFAAHRLLESEGEAVRLIAGSAIWSVGQGRLDTLDHGVARSSGDPRRDAARGDFHVWLEARGHLVDVAARYLPAKLARAYASQPFSTPPFAWRRFPETIIHDLSRRMPDPLCDVSACYGYRPGRPELLDQIRKIAQDRLVILNRLSV